MKSHSENCETKLLGFQERIFVGLFPLICAPLMPEVELILLEYRVTNGEMIMGYDFRTTVFISPVLLTAVNTGMLVVKESFQ